MEELNNTINQLGVTDTYRTLHPTRTDYTFWYILRSNTHLQKLIEHIDRKPVGTRMTQTLWNNTHMITLKFLECSPQNNRIHITSIVQRTFSTLDHMRGHRTSLNTLKKEWNHTKYSLQTKQCFLSYDTKKEITGFHQNLKLLHFNVQLKKKIKNK